MIKKLFLIILLVVVAASCAKIPVQTISLTDAIIKEGKRMHELNVKLVNKMFNEKQDEIDDFIRLEYTPGYLGEFQAQIPEGIDYEEELPGMLQAIIPEINARRDMMQNALETQRIKLITRLNTDYEVFEEASIELRRLIESGIKVNEQRRLAFERIQTLTGNRIDLNQFENEIDRFILSTGDIGGSILELNNTINSLLNN